MAHLLHRAVLVMSFPGLRGISAQPARPRRGWVVYGKDLLGRRVVRVVVNEICDHRIKKGG